MNHPGKLSRLRHALGLVLCIALLPLTMGNTPAFPSDREEIQAASESAPARSDRPKKVSVKTDGPVAITGRTSDNSSLEEASFSVWVSPNQHILGKMKKGDAVPRLRLPERAVTVSGNEFAVTLQRSHLGRKYISDGNLVHFEIEIYDPKTQRVAVSGGSVRSLDTRESELPWADPIETPESTPITRQSTEDLNPVLLDVKMIKSPEKISRTISASEYEPCYNKVFSSPGKVWADIGETFPLDDGGGGMKFSNEATTTYESAISIGGWTPSGSVTMSSGKNFEWPASGVTAGANAGKPRKYEVEVEYYRYTCYNSGGLEMWQSWEPHEHTGGNNDEPISRPDWIGQDMGKCTVATAPVWGRWDSSGGSVGLAYTKEWGVGAKDALQIGIDLSVKREWSDKAEITYAMTEGANWLCGKDDNPGQASSIAQYSKVVQKVCDNFQWPIAKNVMAKAAPENTFNNYAKSTPNGWTGGDSTYSVRMPDGKILWMFSDTFLGPLNSDGTRPTSAPLINSSFVTQDGSQLRTITGGTTSNPRAIMPPPSGPELDWYWLGDGMIGSTDGKDRLQVIFHLWEKFGPDLWDFRLNRMVVATFELGNLTDPISVQTILSTSESIIQWGAGIVPASQSGDGYTYIYGIKDSPINKNLRIARVKGNDLSKVDDWMFLNQEKQAWMPMEWQGSNVLVGVANELSVTKWRNGGFVLISQNSTEGFSNKIRMWASCGPFGPFGFTVGKDVIYEMPETGMFGSYGDQNIFAYNAHVHPALASGDLWTLSYNVNSLDATVGAQGAHYRDPSIYRPRFISFTIAPETTARSAPTLADARLQPPTNSAAASPSCKTCKGVPSR
ncbi:hypothetical protein [Streptomyces sp. NBC_00459]|uniref:hypothetical protein n=1 Tax=Streptomyces sp. NBC_00459 TaxID=2975749 RepID=UPI002E191DBA